MKTILHLTGVLLLLCSCSESFKYIEPDKFNTQISNRGDIETPEELMRLYYGGAEGEGTSKFAIESYKLQDNTYEITLIHEGLGDDAQAGVKIIMTAKKKELSWEVAEIKENWKCRDGRGHTSWGIGLCN